MSINNAHYVTAYNRPNQHGKVWRGTSTQRRRSGVGGPQNMTGPLNLLHNQSGIPNLRVQFDPNFHHTAQRR